MPHIEHHLIAPVELLSKQRSHVLVVMSGARPACESQFLAWYRGEYRRLVRDSVQLVGMRQYEQHEIDITQGRWPRPILRYLGIHELSLDGAQEADWYIEHIALLHRRGSVAQPPATWLYYPVSERVGRSSATASSLLTVAFANAIPGREGEFREWYATRHIRHALKIPALVSGQCFERTQFQKPGALEASFSMIAIYEQEGTPEDMLGSVAELPAGALDFPAIDPVRFAESVYQLV